MKKFLGAVAISLLLVTSVCAMEGGTEYEVESELADGNLIISTETTVDVENAWLGFGDTMEVKKYGVMTPEGEVLLEPILDYELKNYIPFSLHFEDGLTVEDYDATSFYFGDTMGSYHTPANSKKILINEDYKTWKDFDTFYDNFVTDNRFIVKDEGKSIMIDRDLNIITDDYTHIIELDDGKWYASTDPSQTAPVYTVVLDNDGNVITNFDPKLETVVSEWAKDYIRQAEELGIISTNKTTAFNASFCTKEITRNEFCRLAVNLLKIANYDYIKAGNQVSFTDTNDENVLILSNLGVINGVGDDKFDPYSNITREEAAKILINIADLLQCDTSVQSEGNRFSDIDETSNWATDFVLKISALKTPNGESIMGGTSDTTFSPQETYTVEQAITTLVRMSAIYENGAETINIGNQYDYIGNYAEGFFKATDVNYNYYLIDENGKELPFEHGPYSYINDFSDGLVAVCNGDDKWG